MERPVECISCEAPAPFTVNGFQRVLPAGWARYQGTAAGDQNKDVYLCPVCSKAVSDRPHPLG